MNLHLKETRQHLSRGDDRGGSLAGSGLRVGIFCDDIVRFYDPFRQRRSLLQRVTKAMLQRAFSGVTSVLRGHIVATDTLVEALVRESSVYPELFVHSSAQDAIQKQLMSYDLAAQRRGQINVTSIEDLVNGRADGRRLAAWFHPLPGQSDISGVELSQVIRHRCALAYPITILTHALCYHELLYDFFLRFLLEGTYECDSFICSSRASRDAVRKIIAHIESEFRKICGGSFGYQGRVDLIPLCVDISKFATCDKARARDLLRLPRNCFLIVMLGRLSPLKADLYPFVSVLKSLIERNAAKQLLWVVAGTEDAGYSQLIREHAKASGLGKRLQIMLDVTDCTKALLMQAADVFTSPTDCLSESFGLTVIEAMASGVPQVVPDWNGYRDTVCHGETGFLVPTRWMSCTDDLLYTGPIRSATFDHFSIGQSVALDMQEMANYLQLLIDNEALRNEMSQRSRKRASDLYSFRPIAKQYEELWCELERISRSSDARPAPVRLSRPLYYHFFGHYASTALSDETVLSITAAGAEICRAKRIAPPYPAVLSGFQILDEDILRKALDSCLRDGHSDVRLGMLVELLGKACGYHSDHLRRHIMWLIKYGYLTPLDGPQ